MRKTVPGKHSLPEFLLISFLFSWLVWLAIIFFKPAGDLLLPLIFLGAFGPSLGAIFLMLFRGNKEEQRDFWNRIINFKRIGWKWYLVILFIFPLILLLGFSLYNLFGGDLPQLSNYTGGITSIGDFLFLLGVMLLGGPLAEEIGWRGYSLDLLQKKWGKLRASLVLGVIWVIWHLPLFFIEGTSQHQKGFGVAFWSWSLQILLISVIFTWVYNNTQRSILGAILLHLMANFFYPLNLTVTGEIIFTVVRVLVVVVIILSWNYKEKAAFKSSFLDPA